MDHLLYYYVFFYIFRCIRGIYYSRRKSIEQYQILKNVNSFINKSVQDRMHDIAYVSEKVKSKKYNVLLDLIDLVWVIIGIILSVEYIAFIGLLILDILVRIIPMFMIKSLKSHTLIRTNINASNVLAIIICLIIAYNHFIAQIIF